MQGFFHLSLVRWDTAKSNESIEVALRSSRTLSNLFRIKQQRVISLQSLALVWDGFSGLAIKSPKIFSRSKNIKGFKKRIINREQPNNYCIILFSNSLFLQTFLITNAIKNATTSLSV